MRVRFYWFIYSSYFLLLFLLFYFLEYIGALRITRDVLHNSALDSNTFCSFYSHFSSTIEKTPTIIVRLLDSYKEREGSIINTSTANRIVDSSDKYVDFHNFILDKHTCFGCKSIFLRAENNYVPFIIYLFNHHEVLKCFCSFDSFPLTYTAKRLIFIGRHTTLLLIGIIVNGLLVFYSNTKRGELYAINFFLAQPMQNLSDILFQYIYELIFINLGSLLEAIWISPLISEK